MTNDKNLKSLPVKHLQMLDNSAQTQHRKKRQRTDDDDDSDQKHRKQRRIDRKSSRTRRHVFLLRQVSRNRQNRNYHKKSAEKHRRTERGIIPNGVRIQSGKSRTVVARP